jgi:hypothetical protein
MELKKGQFIKFMYPERDTVSGPNAISETKKGGLVVGKLYEVSNPAFSTSDPNWILILIPSTWVIDKRCFVLDKKRRTLPDWF